VEVTRGSNSCPHGGGQLSTHRQPIGNIIGTCGAEKRLCGLGDKVPKEQRPRHELIQEVSRRSAAVGTYNTWHRSGQLTVGSSGDLHSFSPPPPTHWATRWHAPVEVKAVTRVSLY